MWKLEGHFEGSTYFSLASSALSPAAKRIGVDCVWKPVMVLGRPAWPTTSTACPTQTSTERGLRFSSTVINILGCHNIAKLLTIRKVNKITWKGQQKKKKSTKQIEEVEKENQTRTNLHRQNKEVENIMIFPQDDGFHVKACMQHGY
jgi:hypothetical protein